MILRSDAQQRAIRRAGFTLMEVLVVVAIIVVLAGSASVFVFRYLAQAKRDTARTNIEVITKACSAYKLQYDEFPPSLESLIQPPDGRQPFLNSQEDLLDPWGNMYQYDPSGQQNGGRQPDISTLDDNGDLIANWLSRRQR